MIYPNNLCPYCKEPLATDADQVTCPDCGAVLHRQCWLDNEGCTTFGCGGAQAAAPAPAEAGLVCPQCGTANPPDTPFCNLCGRQLSTQATFAYPNGL